MRALLLYPEFPLSYWSFDGVMELVDRKAFMPPLSLITVAALLPQHWQFRLVDCNTHTIDEQDWQWAEIVLISGMMVQKEHFLELIAQARSRNKTVAVGGPYVSSMPDIFEQAQADYIVMGEGEVSIPMFLEALEQDPQGPCRIDPGDQKADMRGSKGAGPGGEGQWVDLIAKRPKDKPFFMWFASFDAHRSWQRDPEATPHDPAKITSSRGLSITAYRKSSW